MTNEFMSNMLLDRMDIAIKHQKMSSRAQRNSQSVENTQNNDNETPPAFEEKDMIKMNKELVQDYFIKMQKSQMVKKSKRDQVS